MPGVSAQSDAWGAGVGEESSWLAQVEAAGGQVFWPVVDEGLFGKRAPGSVRGVA